MKMFFKYFMSGLLSAFVLGVVIGFLNYNAWLHGYSPWVILIAAPICGWANKRFWIKPIKLVTQDTAF